MVRYVLINPRRNGNMGFAGKIFHMDSILSTTLDLAFSIA